MSGTPMAKSHVTNQLVRRLDDLAQTKEIEKRGAKWSNIFVGAGIQLFEVCTLGQPFEVLKTHMAANRADSIRESVLKTWKSGGIHGFYRGLFPWAIVEATTKGGVLLFTAGEIENRLLRSTNISSGICGVLGGMGGGLAQAYTTMGFCTFMKTVEITRLRDGIQKSTFSIAKDIIARDGISGMNRGVTAVALRQMTNWGSRIGISRMTESIIGYVKTPKNMRATFENQKNVDITKNVNNTRSSKLNTADRLIASVVGGILGCWNQPFEVIRVEMQRQANKIITSDSSGSVSRTNIGLFEAAKRIYGESGAMGFYRGVGPRVGLSVYLTVCMVFGGDQIKEYFASL